MLSTGALEDWLKHTDSPIIVQERLSNHAIIESYTNGHIAVVRIVSGKHKSGLIEPISATLHLPIKDQHMSHSGTVADIDIGLGDISNFRTASSDYQPISSLSSFRLPFWDRLINDLTRLHKAIDGYVLVGWDVAITSDGPVFLEGNSSWNVSQHQEPCPDPRPLGETALLNVVRSYWT